MRAQGVSKIWVAVLMVVSASTVLNVILAQSMQQAKSGDLISAALFNSNFTMAAPRGLVAAFYLSACPSGWLLADGTQGTPDMRGVFVRGRDPGNATGRDTDGDRAVGNYQADRFASHQHSIDIGTLYGFGTPYVTDHLNPGNNNVATGITFSMNTGSSGSGSETRSRNVALLFCMRIDS